MSYSSLHSSCVARTQALSFISMRPALSKYVQAPEMKDGGTRIAESASRFWTPIYYYVFRQSKDVWEPSSTLGCLRVQVAATLRPGAASVAGGPSTPPRACSRRSASLSTTSWAPCSARCRPPSTASHPVGAHVDPCRSSLFIHLCAKNSSAQVLQILLLRWPLNTPCVRAGQADSGKTRSL